MNRTRCVTAQLTTLTDRNGSKFDAEVFRGADCNPILAAAATCEMFSTGGTWTKRENSEVGQSTAPNGPRVRNRRWRPLTLPEWAGRARSGASKADPAGRSHISARSIIGSAYWSNYGTPKLTSRRDGEHSELGQSIAVDITSALLLLKL